MPIGLGAALALGGISAGGSIVSSLLNKRKTKGQQTTEQTFSPEQEALRGDLGNLLRSRLANPALDIDEQPIRNRLRSQTNRTFNTLAQTLEAANVRRGFGRGGATGSQQRQLEIARGEKFGEIEAQLQEYLQNLKLQQRDKAIEQAFMFLQPRGSTTTQSGTVSGGIGQGIAEGASDLSFLVALSRLMGGSKAPTAPSMGNV